jgi:hypothetical protein
MGGNGNIIDYTSKNSVHIGGFSNTISNSSFASTIISGQSNIIDIDSTYSSIISSNNSSIISSNRSVIISGDGLSLNGESDVVMVPKLIANETLQTGTISNVNRTEWKLGSTVSGVATMINTGWIEVSLNGITYKLAIVE